MHKMTFALATIAALTFSGSVLAGPNDAAPVPSATQTNIKANVGSSGPKITMHRSMKRASLKSRRHVQLTSRHDRGLHKGFSHSRHLGYAKAGHRDIKAGLKVKATAGTR